MITQYEINMIYQAAFGFRGVPYPFLPPHTPMAESSYDKQPDNNVVKKVEFELEKPVTQADNSKYTENLPYLKSLAGTPLYMPTGFNIGGSVVQLPDEPIITCSTRKNIVETTLAGNTRRGTVKEIINTDDWKINIKGLCIDYTKNGYPEQQCDFIQQLYDKNSAIRIINYMLNSVFSIRNVVITSLAWLPMPGKPYSQAYEMELISDEDFLLIIQ